MPVNMGRACWCWLSRTSSLGCATDLLKVCNVRRLGLLWSPGAYQFSGLASQLPAYHEDTARPLQDCWWRTQKPRWPMQSKSSMDSEAQHEIDQSEGHEIDLEALSVQDGQGRSVVASSRAISSCGRLDPVIPSRKKAAPEPCLCTIPPEPGSIEIIPSLLRKPLPPGGDLGRTKCQYVCSPMRSSQENEGDDEKAEITEFVSRSNSRFIFLVIEH